MGGSGPSLPQQAQPLPATAPDISKASDFLTSQVGVPQAPYPGPYVAPATPEENYATNQIAGLDQEALASNFSPVSVNTMTTLAGGGFLPGASPYLDQIARSLRALTGQQQNRDVANLNAKYARYGEGYSSPAAQAEGDYLASSNASLDNTLGTLGLSAYNTGVSNMASAAEQGLQYEPGLAKLLYSTGESQRAIDQAGLTNQQAVYDKLQQSLYQPLAYLTGLVPGGSAMPQYSPSPVPGIIGGLGSLLASPVTSILGGLLGI